MLTLSREHTGGIPPEEGGFVSSLWSAMLCFFCSSCPIGHWCMCVWRHLVVHCRSCMPDPDLAASVQTRWLLWCDSQQHCGLQPCVCGAILCLQTCPPVLALGVCVCFYGGRETGYFLLSWRLWTRSGPGNPADFSTIYWLQPCLLQWGLNPGVFASLFQAGPSLGTLTQL